MKELKYNLKVKIVKHNDNTHSAIVDGAGFIGQSSAFDLGEAFVKAYRSVIDQASAEMLSEES